MYKDDQDEKQAADKKYDLGSDVRQREKEAADFDDIEKSYDKTADDSQENANIEKAKSKNTDTAKSAEQNPSWKTNVSDDNRSNGGSRFSPANLRSTFRKKGPIGLIVTLFLGGTVGLGGLFGGALAPLAFVENVTDDLNDQLAAMDIRSDAMFRAKIPRGDVKESIAGCTKLSIRCKFKTMSPKQVARYEKAGIAVTGEPTRMPGNRIAPTEFTFRGEKMTAQQFNDNLKTNQALSVAYKRALNMKFLGLNDATFTGRTLARFGVSKKPPELKGSHQDRVNALMNKAGQTDVNNLRFIPAVDANGEAILDGDGNPMYRLEGDTSNTNYSEAAKTRMEQSVSKLANATPPSRLSGNLLKGLSILGYWDLACTVKSMIGGAAVAAKLSNYYELAQYAMPVLSLTSQLKASEISVENGQVLGEFFADTDDRAEIVDVNASVQTDDEGNITPNEEIIMKPNPDYGKNAMDSPLYKLSSMGQYNSVSTTERQYSLGMGQSALLSGFSNFADVLDAIGNVAGNCDFVQNWAVRGIGLVAGVFAGIFSGGGTIAIQAAVSGSLIVASLVLESIINNALSGSVLAEDMDQAPMDRAAAQWSGTASILGEAAKNRGMMPANAEQIVAYNTLQAETKNEYIAVEKANAHPLDVTNQYSFLGTLSRSALPYVTSANNIATSVGSIMSFTMNSFGKLFTPTATYAATVDPTRFKVCDDQGYKEINIDPDVQCNIRYVMPAADLALDTDAVALYMEENGYVEKDTTTGLPAGYTPPVPQESQGFAMDMLNGVTNTFYNTREYGSEYGKFLDYCAYRMMPFGETFEETGQINGVDPRWVDGSKCTDTDEMLSHFRIYTIDKSVSEAEDEDAIIQPASNTTPEQTTENSGNVVVGGWTFPTTAGTPLGSAFGPRGGGYHTGIDLNAPTGSPFYATRDGVVATKEYNVYTIMGDGGAWCPVLGLMSDPNQKDIHITHTVNGETYTSVYAHMSRYLKKTGDVVKAGDLIGYTGGSGCSSGPHVHFEIWKGVATPSIPGPGMQDPWPLINP